jgi:hypothetical protein
MFFLTALRVEETWERTPEVLWKHVARELMQSAIADKKVRISSRMYIFQNADPGPGLLFIVDLDPSFWRENYILSSNIQKEFLAIEVSIIFIIFDCLMFMVKH